MLTSQIAVDELFDLDLALTMPEQPTIDERHPDVDYAVEQMPTVVMGSGRRCAVCLEGFGEAGKQVPCGHVFHKTCISRWLSAHSSCPLCRRKLYVSGKVSL